ncbi:AAA family ATPase [Virgibacillus dokdonensis]|uniref:ATP-dependent zinc metalloprotease FtsH n=1 Tax=Virgibacillus dokdonensis TaxID=302167 RepID=A0A2K9J592_9BACI|nr:ATP-binding protein [Virgibacillus dokdonensis]AUJ25211.1 ATP-dependent zinc metalloprotease FtsH [Virgibacillus dokdonensis]
MRMELIYNLINNHYLNDESGFKNTVIQIANEEELKGNLEIYNRLNGLVKANGKKIKYNNNNLFTPSSGRSSNKTEISKNKMISPRDKNTNFELMEIHYPGEKKNKLFLSETVSKKIDTILSEYKQKEILESNNLPIENRLLLCGPPGCGKTSTAYLISEKLQLPLAYVRLDTLVSSLLGQTGSNIRKIFEAVKNKNVILFLDEFDAIAKMRDDKQEMGELKRVVNTLLQNLDLLPNDVFVIAATNHEKLLDKAVWRRFNTVLYLDLPSEELRGKYIENLIKSYNIDDTNLDYKKLSKLTSKLSYSQLYEISLKAIKHTLLNDDIKHINTKSYTKSLLEVLFLYNFDDGELDISKIHELRKNGLTLQILSDTFNIPRSTLADRLKKEEQ